MEYSGFVTLFSGPPQPRLGTRTLLVSAVVHGAVFSLLAIRVMEQQHIIERFPQGRFAVRVVDFHSRESQVHPWAGGGLVAHGSASVARSGSREIAAKRTAKAPPSPQVLIAGSPSAARLTPQRMPAPQTLLQPDLPQPVLELQKASVPLIILWKPETVAPRRIVLPPPDRASIAVNRPSLESPISEENLGDVRISSTTLVTREPAARPSTTSPLVVKGPEETKKLPETTSQQLEPPTPSRLLSLSDTRVAEGKVIVPMANQADKANAAKLIPGLLKNSSPMGNGESASRLGDTSAGKGAGERTEGQAGASTASPHVSDSRLGPDKVSRPGENPAGGVESSGSNAVDGAAGPSSDRLAEAATAGSDAGPGSDVGPGMPNSSSTVHISLPKNGQFGVVVFGSSIAERYPETAELWSGRMASTVYLRVGQPKSWILQYAPPRTDESLNAGAERIEAPWPYEIARPTIDPADLDSDALILHGFVNKDGRFEKLEILFPSGLAQAPVIESALNQWQFRPAKRSGQPVSVEVLLIVPDQSQ